MILFWFLLLVVALPLFCLGRGGVGAFMGAFVMGLVVWLIGLVGYMVFAGPPQPEEPTWEDRHPYGECWDTYRGYEC